MIRAPRRSRAFTLIELVLVVAILATIGGLVVMSADDVEKQATTGIVQHQLDEVRKAILQFRADTGFLPRRGPFNLAGREPGAAVVEPAGVAWFDHPANLSQLFTCPLDPSHALSRWDPGRRRGWRGPYLSGRADDEVSMAALSPSGTLPWAAAPPWLQFPTVGDAHALPPDNVTLQWASGGRRGRPIFVFDLDPGLPGPDDDHQVGTDIVQLARIVSSGPDGRYDFGASGSDDAVLSLLR